MDENLAFKTFRNTSSAFISNKYVRSYIFNKYKNKCNYCDSIENLEIDHIKSVCRCFKNNLIDYCNTKENLQLLCRKCNSSKLS